MLPLGVGAFVMLTQPPLRNATLQTPIGHLTLALGLGLDVAAVAVLVRLTKLDV
jgi:Flp pilus assembly protein TadB